MKKYVLQGTASPVAGENGKKQVRKWTGSLSGSSVTSSSSSSLLGSTQSSASSAISGPQQKRMRTNSFAKSPVFDSPPMPSAKFLERTLYFDIYETPNSFIKVSKNILCQKTKTNIESWENANTIDPTTMLNLISPDSCWHQRIESVMTHLDHTTIAKVVATNQDADCMTFKRKLVTFPAITQMDACTEYIIEKNTPDCIPMSKVDLTKLPRQAIQRIIEQIEEFVKYIKSKGYAALVLNEGCFLYCTDTHSIRYYRHEHIYQTTKAKRVKWMEAQKELFQTYLVELFDQAPESKAPQESVVYEPLTCTQTQQIFFKDDDVDIDNLLEGASLLATGLDSLVFLSKDERYALKIVPTVDKAQYIQQNNARYHNNHYYEAVQNFYKEVQNLEKIRDAGSPHYVVCPVAAYTTSKPFTEYDFVYDIPGYHSMQYQQQWSRNTPCAGVIVTKYIGNRRLSDEWLESNYSDSFLRDKIGYVYLFLKQIPLLHEDLHLNNILVKRTEPKLLMLNYERKKYYWISQPFDYVIIDFGRCQQRPIDDEFRFASDLTKMCDLSLPIPHYMPFPYEDQDFVARPIGRQATLQFTKSSLNNSVDSEDDDDCGGVLVDVSHLYSSIDFQIYNQTPDSFTVQPLPVTRTVSARIIDVSDNKMFARKLVHDMEKVGISGTFYNGNDNINHSAYVSVEAIKLLYDASIVKDAWKLVAIQAAASRDVISKFNDYLATLGSCSIKEKQIIRERPYNLSRDDIIQLLRDFYKIRHGYCVTYEQFWYALDQIFLTNPYNEKLFYFVVKVKTPQSVGANWIAVVIEVE